MPSKKCTTDGLIVVEERSLTSQNFGLPGDPENSFSHEQYLWSDFEVELPARIDLTVTFDTGGEFIPVFSQNR